MSSVQNAYAKLNKNSTASPPAKVQLVYPIDYLTDKGHPGLVVVFEICRIAGGKAPVTLKGLTPSTSGSVVGGETTSVAMQDKAGSSSLRSKTASVQGTQILGKLYKKSNESIVLPIPSNFTASYNANWASSDMGNIGRIADFGKSVSEGEATAQMAGDLAKSGAAKMIDNAVGSGNSTQDFNQLNSGTILNAYSEMMFRSMTNRIIPFQYTFTPRNAKESEAIQEIIQLLKYSQLPELRYSDSKSSNSSFLLAPSVLDVSLIDVSTGKHIAGLPKISTCAISNLEVNYTPNGLFSANKNSNSTSIMVSFQLIELVLLTKNMSTDVGNSY